jgi:hypothetical protein
MSGSLPKSFFTILFDMHVSVNHSARVNREHHLRKVVRVGISVCIPGRRQQEPSEEEHERQNAQPG